MYPKEKDRVPGEKLPDENALVVATDVLFTVHENVPVLNPDILVQLLLADAVFETEIPVGNVMIKEPPVGIVVVVTIVNVNVAVSPTRSDDDETLMLVRVPGEAVKVIPDARVSTW